MNKLSNSHNNTTCRTDQNGPFSATCPLENDDKAFPLKALNDIFNENLVLRIIMIYLVYTLIIFLLNMLRVNRKFNFKWYINIHKYNYVKWLNKYNDVFLYSNLSILFIIDLFIIYFLKWFIRNINLICIDYVEKNNLEIEISEINYSVSNNHILYYLNSDILLQKVLLFSLLIITYSIISYKVSINKLDFKWIYDNIYFGKDINVVIQKLSTENEKINIILMISFIFTSYCFFTYCWYIFINNFDLLTHIY